MVQSYLPSQPCLKNAMNRLKRLLALLGSISHRCCTEGCQQEPSFLTGSGSRLVPSVSLPKPGASLGGGPALPAGWAGHGALGTYLLPELRVVRAGARGRGIRHHHLSSDLPGPPHKTWHVFAPFPSISRAWWESRVARLFFC